MHHFGEYFNAGQIAFFDVRVFNPNTSRYGITEIGNCYELYEREEKRQYNERILNIEQGSFTLLVMSTNYVFGKEYTKFYGRLAELSATKRNEC